MAKREDFSRRRSPPALIRALGQLQREDVEFVAPEVVSLLSHPEPDVRSAALSAVFVLWHLDDRRGRATEMLRTDRHAEVRASAAYAVAATSSESTRREDAMMLLRALENTNEDREVRRAAYEGLLLLFGRPDFPDAISEFDPSAHVDWDWIAETRSILG